MDGNEFPVAKSVQQNPVGSRLFVARMRKEDQYSTVLYWLQSPNKTSAGGFEHLLWLYRQDLLLKRTDGCFVKLAYYGRATPDADAQLLQLGKLYHQALSAWLEQQQPPVTDP